MKKILLAVDQDGLVESVVPAVAAVARGEGAEVVALHITDPVAPDDRWWNATEVLNDVVVRLAREGLKVEAQAREGGRGKIAEEIVAAAGEMSADLIALGSHGRGDLGGLLLGSVGYRVASLTSIPILVARPSPAAERSWTLRRIMVAVDRTREADAAVALAAEVAKTSGAEVRLVHALENVVVETGAFFEPEDEAAAQIEGQARDLRSKGIAVSTELVGSVGSVGARLADAAAAWAADLVVIGSRRLGGLAGLVQGSTSHAVVAAADRPVLLAGRPQIRPVVVPQPLPARAPDRPRP